MRAYGMTVSQDVVRDAIQSPTHPGCGDLAKMAIGSLDMIIGQLSADVGTRKVDDLYRLTSPLFWRPARRVRAMGRRPEPSAHHRGSLTARGRHGRGHRERSGGGVDEQLFKAT